MEKQIVGTRQPLQSGPADMTQNRKSSGTAQISGSEAPLSREPLDMGNFFEGGSQDRQLLGSQAPLSFKPHRGYESYPTRMSVVAQKEKKA